MNGFKRKGGILCSECGVHNGRCRVWEVDSSVFPWTRQASANNATHELVRLEDNSHKRVDPLGNFAIPSYMCVEGVVDEEADGEGVLHEGRSGKPCG